MDNINKTYKKLFQKGLKLLKTSSNSDISTTFHSKDLLNLNLKPINSSHSNKIKKDFIISKDKTTTNNNTSIKYPSLLLKNRILNTFNHEVKKIEVSTQKDFFPKSTKYKISRIKSSFLKNLLEKIPDKNKNEIDYVLESPYRGIEKIQYSTGASNNKNDKNNQNLFRPVYINNTYKGYFCKNKNNLNNIHNFSFAKNRSCKDLILDKYSKRKKIIDNPLKKLSKLSGVSCYKLRQVINYSLNHKIKYFENKEKKQKQLYDNNRYKNTYSIITLKSKKKRNFETFKNESINLDNDASFENVIYSKNISDIKPLIDFSRHNELNSI